MKRLTLQSLAVAIIGVFTVPAYAQSQGNDSQVISLPAGQGCAFALDIEIVPNPHRVFKEFKDKKGKVRQLTAGAGNTLTFTNVATGNTVSLKSNGSVEHITLNPDGSQTYVVTGHNVLILFPSDVPAGPTTTLYVGRLEFTISATGVFTVKSFSGTSTDLCAALST
jgi:hypothetical protein